MEIYAIDHQINFDGKGHVARSKSQTSKHPIVRKFKIIIVFEWTLVTMADVGILTNLLYPGRSINQECELWRLPRLDGKHGQN